MTYGTAQHIAKERIVLCAVQYSTAYKYGTVQFSSIQFKSVQLSAVQSSIVENINRVQSNLVQIQFNAVQCSAVQCNTVQYSIWIQCTFQSNVIELNSNYSMQCSAVRCSDAIFQCEVLWCKISLVFVSRFFAWMYQT